MFRGVSHWNAPRRVRTVPRGYGSHADFLDMVRESADRRAVEVLRELQTAFSRYVREERVSVIQLADVDVFELGRILLTIA